MRCESIEGMRVPTQTMDTKERWLRGIAEVQVMKPQPVCRHELADCHWSHSSNLGRLILDAPQLLQAGRRDLPGSYSITGGRASASNLSTAIINRRPSRMSMRSRSNS